MSHPEPPPPPHDDPLAREVARLREALGIDAEWERLEVRPLPAPETDAALTAALNTFLSGLALSRIGPDWRQAGWHALTPEEAVRLLTHLLSRTLAYSDLKRELADAREGALAFLSLFGPASRLLTHSTLHTVLRPDGSPPPGGCSYSSGRLLTQATFEGGVIAVGAGRIGLLWFTDED